jgi:4-hydroxythreonine-4-phosphate dehydrogenase
LASCAADKPLDPEVAGASGVIDSIERAADALKLGRARAVVTTPIMKDVLYGAGLKHFGHTQLLGELALRWWDHRSEPVMVI